MIERHLHLSTQIAHNSNFYVDLVYSWFLNMVKALYLLGTRATVSLSTSTTSLFYHCYSMLITVWFFLEPKYSKSFLTKKNVVYLIPSYLYHHHHTKTSQISLKFLIEHVKKFHINLTLINIIINIINNLTIYDIYIVICLKLI